MLLSQKAVRMSSMLFLFTLLLFNFGTSGVDGGLHLVKEGNSFMNLLQDTRYKFYFESAHK